MEKTLDPEVIRAANRLRYQADSSFSAQQQTDLLKVLDAFPELAPVEGWEDNS